MDESRTEDPRLEEMRQLVFSATQRAKAVDHLATEVREANNNVERLAASTEGLATSEDIERRVGRAESRLVGLIVVIAVLVAAFAWVGYASATHSACVQRNDTRGVIVDVLNQSGEIKAPDGASPEIQELYRRAREDNAKFKIEAMRRLQPEDCTIFPWL